MARVDGREGPGGPAESVHSTFSICVVVAFVVSFAFFGCINFVPLFFQMSAGTSATATGLLFLPAMVGLAIASLVAGQVIAKTGRYKWFPVTSTGAAALSAFVLSTMTVDTSVAVASGALALLGIGVGLSQQVTTLAAQNTAPRSDMGVATSTVGFARNIGVSFGAAIFGALLNARLAVEAAKHLPADVADRLTRGTVAPADIERLSAELRGGFAQAYAESLSTVFLSAAPVLLVGFVLALFLKDVKLERRGPGGPGGPGAAAAAQGGERNRTVRTSVLSTDT